MSCAKFTWRSIMGDANEAQAPSSAKGIARVLPKWFPLLGWALSALLFSALYLGYNKNYFCASGAQSQMASLFAIPATWLGSGRPSNQSQKLVYQEAWQEEAEHFEAEHFEAEHFEAEHFEEPEYIEEEPFYCKSPGAYLTDFHLLDCATRRAQQHERNNKALGDDAPPPRVAFMFITRGPMPHEPLWRRFFLGNEDRYSLYVHAAPKFKYPRESFFHGHQIPSRTISRFSINMVDAMRSVLAYSILDTGHGVSNSWFVFLCETSIPIRSFDFTYNYLMNSSHSFVESFIPKSGYRNWDAEPFFIREQLRKGELWMALQRRHALMVVNDWSIYYKFKNLCRNWCTYDEEYVQTLLALQDPQGIENRTTMYVDWAHPHKSSPFLFHVGDMPLEWFQDIRNRTFDKDGEYHDTSLANEYNITSKVCYYNGIPNSQCFLFVRKVSDDATEYLSTLPASVLGY